MRVLKSDLIKQAAQAEGEKEQLELKDKLLREDFAAIFGRFKEDGSMFDYRRNREPVDDLTWNQIFFEVGKLMGDLSWGQFSKRVNNLEKSFDQIVKVLSDQPETVGEIPVKNPEARRRLFVKEMLK